MEAYSHPVVNVVTSIYLEGFKFFRHLCSGGQPPRDSLQVANHSCVLLANSSRLHVPQIAGMGLQHLRQKAPVSLTLRIFVMLFYFRDDLAAFGNFPSASVIVA